MLSVAKFPTHLQYGVLLLHGPISRNVQFPTKSLCLFPIRAHLPSALVRRMENWAGCNALKTRKKGDFSYAEMDGPDESEDDVEFDDDDDNDDVVIPLQNMKKWLENRPRGFGEGREYDTSLEDKLMEEIEQARKAQLANVNKLKNSPPTANRKTSNGDKVLSHVGDGFRVRLFNLPKKKNIHRDLKLAFTEVPGVLGITPVVSGNEKTRDPVCKGLAFVNFKSQEDAQSFVQNFTGKSIHFGKVEKQIKCEMMNSDSASDYPSLHNNKGIPQLPVLNMDRDSDTDAEIDVSLLNPSDENQNDSNEADNAQERNFSVQSSDDNGEDASDSDLVKETQGRQEAPVNSLASMQGRKLKIKDKKAAASKARKDKIPKLNIPGSAKRLKLGEKTAFVEAFTKYGANSAAVKEQSR